MRWLVRSLITILILVPIFVYIANTESLEIENQQQNTGILGAFENWAYDTRIKLNFSEVVGNEVVILDIDEKSIAAIGQWPWSRDKLAEIVDVLFDYYGIDVLGFDITYPEPERAFDLDLLSQIENQIGANPLAQELDFKTMRAQRERDKIFAKSFENRNIVLGFVLDGGEEWVQAVGKLPAPTIKSDDVNEKLIFLELGSYTGNLPILQDSAGAGGNFNPVTIDPDGKIRRLPMLLKHKGDIYDSLSLAIIKKKLGVEKVEFVYDSFSEEDFTTLLGIKLGSIEFPVGEFMTMLVPYKGEPGAFQYYSIIDLLNKEIPRSELKNSVAIVGTTAAGLKDFRVTPASENYPGVEIHANVVSAVLSGETIYQPEYQDAIQFTGLIFVGILLTIIMPIFSVVFSTIITFLLFISVWFGNLILWKTEGLVLPVAPTLSFIVLCYLAHLIYGSFVETRRKKQLTKLFGQYVPPELVDEMETDLASYSMETKEAELTVMFADIKGFTTLSEALKAEQVSELLNEFLTIMTEVIHSKRGTIDKYMGDAIMAFWGAPLADEEHAQKALEAAFLMQEKMQELNDRLNQRGLPNISICIGINTGIMSVGNMGSEFRMAYTVIGDSVNLAARLEALTRTYGVGIMLGESTRRVLTDTLCIELDKVRVKGKDNSVLIYEPLSYLSDMTDAQAKMLEKHNLALQAYRAKNWSLSIRYFSELTQEFPDKTLFKMYLERLEQFLETPPAKDWDGVYVFSTK